MGSDDTYPETFKRILDWSRWENCLEGDNLDIPRKANFVVSKTPSTDYPESPDEAAEVEKVIADWRFRIDQRQEGRGTLLYNCLVMKIRSGMPDDSIARENRVSTTLFHALLRQAIKTTHYGLYPDDA